jgi:ribose/xylose/arabinose/galactoside ABC-type transport system permease subunit
MNAVAGKRAPERPPASGDGGVALLRSLPQRFGESIGALGVGLLIVVLIEIVFFSVRSDFFLDAGNFKNIGRAMTIIGIAAIGQTVVIISGGFDLSVGSIMAACGILSAYLINSGTAFAPAIAAALGLGLVIGFLNGSIVAYLRINPLIATLATLSIVRGLAYVITGGQAEVISNDTYLSVGTNDFLGIPLVVVMLIGLFLVVGFLLPRTSFGRYAYAIGSNIRAARLSGVHVARWQLAFYGLSGLLAAVAGCVTVSRTGTAEPSANLTAELEVITAVIVGGASLAGGRGRLFGTFLGLAVLAILSNGLVLLGVASYWQLVVKGGVLLLAVSWDELRRTRRDVD